MRSQANLTTLLLPLTVNLHVIHLIESMSVVFKQRNSHGLHLRGSTRATAAAPQLQRPIRVSSRGRKVITMSDAREQREAAAELHPGDHVEWGAPIPGKRKTSGEVVVSMPRCSVHSCT